MQWFLVGPLDAMLEGIATAILSTDYFWMNSTFLKFFFLHLQGIFIYLFFIQNKKNKIMTKVNQKKSKPSSRSPETPHFTVSYTNIKGLRSNLPEVEAFIEETKPDILSLSETG